MNMPPHPGEFITNFYLEPNGISGRELAEKLGVAPSTLSRTNEKGTDLFSAHADGLTTPLNTIDNLNASN
ncbi:hypothetical protein OMD46_06415 [Pseudomonas sp. MDMC_285]|nr:hypothetical protein [Pseudomonas sp. MDMC_285]